ncbi:heavy metal-responsive transcriptional regulator [Chroococcus sp. FPU101]|uniref:heavy metal-responsive transcriptional regulator n=1 Tax=Chroococcus sp. FPU101 TaxID=1974212 RepID=UPI001A8C215C|nr:heavy metal-responsive transcriptional regulator [Chroococcus sp. FPU101]GFE69115.1 transcriptional regulator, MerR family [Chroococcus sp. FPU101]
MMKIGVVSKRAGVSVGTLRYYEKLGLVQPLQRSENGYRYYDKNVIQRILFIRKAQALQFSLADIKQILTIREQGYPACAKVKELLNQKIYQLNIQIQQLNEFRVELEQYQTRWSERPLDQPESLILCSLIDEVQNYTREHLLTSFN